MCLSTVLGYFLTLIKLVIEMEHPRAGHTHCTQTCQKEKVRITPPGEAEGVCHKALWFLEDIIHANWLNFNYIH